MAFFILASPQSSSAKNYQLQLQRFFLKANYSARLSLSINPTNQTGGVSQ